MFVIELGRGGGNSTFSGMWWFRSEDGRPRAPVCGGGASGRSGKSEECDERVALVDIVIDVRIVVAFVILFQCPPISPR